MRALALLAATGLLVSSCAVPHARISSLGKPPGTVAPLLGVAHIVTDEAYLRLDPRRSLRDKVLPHATDFLSLAGLPPASETDAPSPDRITCGNLSDALCSTGADRAAQLAAVSVARECFRDFDASGREDARGALLRCAITDDDAVRTAISGLLVERGILGERAASLIPSRHRERQDNASDHRDERYDLSECGLDAPRDDHSVMIVCRSAHREPCDQDYYAFSEYRVTASGWQVVAHADSTPLMRACLIR